MGLEYQNEAGTIVRIVEPRFRGRTPTQRRRQQAAITINGMHPCILLNKSRCMFSFAEQPFENPAPPLWRNAYKDPGSRNHVTV
jgi:hypothetical protein